MVISCTCLRVLVPLKLELYVNLFFFGGQSVVWK